MLRDADASIAVTVEGYRYSTAANAMRTRVYSVMRDVRRDHGFCSIVTSPSDSPDLKPRVNWAAFHETVKLSSLSGGGGGGGGALGGGGGARGVSFARPPAAAPPAATAPSSSAAAALAAVAAASQVQQQQQQQQREQQQREASAARISINLHRNSMDVLRSDAVRQAAAGGGALTSAAAAAAAAPPSSAPPAWPSTVTDSFTAAAAAAAAAAAEATRALPPEAGGGMLLPPGLDPDSTFRLRSAAAQGARARLDASLFEEDPSSSPTRRSEGGEGAV